MQYGLNMKIAFCDFFLNSMFDLIESNHKKEIDKLIFKNAELLTTKALGFIVDGQQFLLSNVNNNLSFQQLCRSELNPVHESIVEPALQIIKDRQRHELDRLRFKGLINGLLSVVKNTEDFNIVFYDDFYGLVQDFNHKYHLTLCTSFPLLIGDPKVTLKLSDLDFIRETKEKFQIQLNRYKFLKEVIGL